ncbi:GNAT family N-acetyltransferase [Bradyrhizobium diazoefficiens]|uniref:GNAT family N-acetyltransferase n=1 Tax=Bradyrhizobium diazoefficiens TaxID=1355477 RepID=UPI00272D6C74|nr:GNAT family N-acetyltransferase [Bradyrhizobium diazoefficiens]WLA62365.1 GNAT family N-acetyltransferase [Bradyrhizobium diazoefficiens]
MTGHLIKNPAPAGFYAMGVRMEREADLPEAQRYLFPWDRGSTFPALHLQYVAVQRQLQGRKLGTVLMGAAMDDFYEVAVRSGIFALTLTAIDKKTAEFYRKLGFIDFGAKDISQPNLLLPAASIIEFRQKIGLS